MLSQLNVKVTSGTVFGSDAASLPEEWKIGQLVEAVSDSYTHVILNTGTYVPEGERLAKACIKIQSGWYPTKFFWKYN